MLYLASDGAGFPLKIQIAALLSGKGIAFTDIGAGSDAPSDYAPYGRKLAEAVAAGGGEARGILFCGTGAGISMAANRVRGARCVCCSEPATARLSRLHNDANILAVGARIVGAELAADIVTAFLETPFFGEERHVRRIAGIEG
ncbi:MAG: RpiB/LacA/LacB family sugar-phosphate isomerase [Oscillospiraceae bacterium]|jgi:ribose 5-phosphate isomerase B|nr:RpiB/LacA/LacB family sugar-phosphate isomerase [Oscillospiraceae bacterium]